MKKFFVLSLLFLSLNGLYAMEDTTCFPFSKLPYEEHKQAIMGDLSDVPMSLEHKLPILGEYSVDEPVFSLCFSPDGNKLASVGIEGEVIIVDLCSGMLRRVAGRGKSAFYRVAWRADGWFVSSFEPCADEADEAAWDIRSIEVEGGDKEENRDLKLGSGGSPDRSPDDFCIDLIGEKKDELTWMLIKGRDKKGGLSLQGKFAPGCWSPDGSMFAVWREDKKVRIVNMLSSLLALSQHDCEKSDQILLLGKLQEMLRKEEPSLVIGAEERTMLEGMGGVKNWFIINKASKKPLWLLTPRRYTEEVKFWKEGLLHRLAGTKRKRRDLLSTTLPPLAAGALAWLAVRYLQVVGSQ